jgi:hypothetical protein
VTGRERPGPFSFSPWSVVIDLARSENGLVIDLARSENGLGLFERG